MSVRAEVVCVNPDGSEQRREVLTVEPECSSNPGVTPLEPGTADTTSETRLRVRHSEPWSWSVIGDGLHVASMPSVVS